MEKFSAAEKQLLLKLAKESITYGLQHQRLLPIDVKKFSQKLQAKLACFVTLKTNHQLRGCIGSLEARQALVLDIVHNAYAAAFADPRFMPLRPAEISTLEINISILDKPEPINFTSEKNLIAQLRPNIDGLVLNENGHQGTFLPAVWEELPDPKTFLAHLKLKAGLPLDYWSSTITCQRYTVEHIP